MHKLNSIYSYSSASSTVGDFPIVVAMGSGKGGVGKSFISSNLAIAFARMAYKVVLVDLDLGGANLHTYFGGKTSPYSLTDFLKERVSDCNQLCLPTEVRNLSIITGSNDSFDIANISEADQNKLMRGLKQLHCDVVFLDLGAGTTNSTLDFFTRADKALMTVTPDPTSIENAYRFMKSAFYRKLKQTEKDAGIQSLIEEAMDQKNQLGIKSPSDLINYIRRTDNLTAQNFANDLRYFEMNIILNQVRTGSDIEIGRGMTSIARNYFGIQVNYLGHIAHDNAVWQALRKKRPLMLEHPSSALNNQLFAVAKLILGPALKKAVV